MTIKSKTFYVCNNYMDVITGNPDTGVKMEMTNNKEGICVNEITISWKEDRKAEVTESQIDEIIKEWRDPKSYPYSLDSFIKERIFKDVK